MRIITVNNLYPPQELGGYGRGIYDFVNGLRGLGHEVRVFTANLPQWQRGQEYEPHVSRSLELFGSWEGGSTRQLPLDQTTAVLLANHEKLSRAVREFRPDAALVGNTDFVSPFVPHLLVGHGVATVHHVMNRQAGYQPANAPRGGRFAMAFCSRWLRDAVAADGFAVGADGVIYPGAHVEAFAWDGWPARDTLRVAYASLVMPYKGAHVLVEGLGELRRRGVPFEATIAGDSADPAYVAQLKARCAELGIAEVVAFPGFLRRPELVALFRSHNVLVFPSVFEEPFGISQVEAMAAGAALVSSATGGAAEVVEDGVSALAFKNGDGGSLADALQRLHADRELWRRIAEKGRERAVTKFDARVTVRELEGMMGRLAGG